MNSLSPTARRPNFGHVATFPHIGGMAEPNAPTPAVGEVLRDGLTPQERAQAIRMADRLIARYDHEWKRSGCFAAKGNADRCRLMREQLTKETP